MATNEALAVQAAAGDEAALWALWRANQGWIRKTAWRVIRARSWEGRGNSIEFDDLLSESWFALCEAVQTFRPEKGRFLSWFHLHLQTYFAEATGLRGRRELLNSCDSLDMPLDESDPEGETMEAVAGSDPWPLVEEALHREDLRRVVGAAVSQLPADEGEALRLRYRDGLTIRAAAEAAGCRPSVLRLREQRALTALRRRREILELDSRTNFYRGGRDPVLANVLRREELRERGRARW